MLVWEITKQDKASVGTLSASFGHYALILLMSPRLIVLVICSETSALTTRGDLWEPPLTAIGTIPCPEATTSSPPFNAHMQNARYIYVV